MSKKKPSLKPKPVPTAPMPFKVPLKCEIVLTCDDSLAFKDAIATFTFRYPNDPFSGGADRQIVQLDDKMRALIANFFSQSVDRMCEKHKTCSVEEANKLPKLQAPPAKP